MAEIRPFRGMRYTESEKRTLDDIVCPPYDIISDEQREEYLARNHRNIIRLELPKGGDERYKEAGDTLERWLSNGILIFEEKDSIYVYEMEFTAGGERKKLKGFVSLVKLEEFSKGIILPHEETLSKAKQDRFSLMSETFCNFSQIYSLYADEGGSVYSLVDGCSQGEPDMSVTDDDGTVHRMWIVSDEDVISKISAGFADKKIYIADGHHRYETALNFHKHLVGTGRDTEDGMSGYIAMMLVNMENEGLEIFPTHRIVRGLDGFDAGKLAESCGRYFVIEETGGKADIVSALRARYERGENAFAMYSGGRVWIMTLKDISAVKRMLPEMSDAYCGLDVSVLHSLVLEKMLGIDKENMAAQKNLKYTRSADAAIEAVDGGSADCCFILNPTRVSEVREVALAGEKMPQKSTYFYPKLITGLVMNKFGSRS